MKNVFAPETTAELINRVNALTPDSRQLWGKMDVAQMLAHCNVTYELVYEDKHPTPNPIMKFLVKLLVKDFVVNEKPFKQNGHTAPHFKIADARDFEVEKNRLVGFLQKTQQLGESHFEGKDSHSFGKLTSTQWNNMFYKHLNHHLCQFGV
ncbi:DUF1569 domain-containing protein [Pontibacter burrus]|uniref:DUF1569 domain-containing protein n=1 Tax=Pontibacter burrus TaxID=2704466 RepID=A0A6B3LXS1_9BACT|nr:DUF1569 domain-containing protein [Pontibacter burrus]NEM98440.1 DUF1569 domain-containing protein [Pontibacter burrus]